MEAAVDPADFKELLIILGAAGVVIPLFARLRITPVLGFMLVGIAVGPFGLGRFAGSMPWLWAITIPDPDAIAPIARLGIVMLLFMIGLELSFERLWLMRRLVFGLGTLQVVASTALLAAIWWAITGERAAALVVGMAGAMSSTAVVLQVLASGNRLGTPSGRAGFAVLLFQDLAVVPILFALGMLASRRGGGGATQESLMQLAFAVGQALLAVAAIVGGGRLVLRPLFRSVARTRSPELFMAACLLVVFATALAAALAGLSMALGGAGRGAVARRHRVPPPDRGHHRAVQGPVRGRVPDLDRAGRRPHAYCGRPRDHPWRRDGPDRHQARRHRGRGAAVRPAMGGRPALRPAAGAGGRVQFRDPVGGGGRGAALPAGGRPDAGGGGTHHGADPAALLGRRPPDPADAA